MTLMRRAAAVVSRIRPTRRHAAPMPPAPTTAIHEGYQPAGPAAVPAGAVHDHRVLRHDTSVAQSVNVPAGVSIVD